MKRIKTLVASIVFAASTAASADPMITVTWNSNIFSPLGSVDVGTVTHPDGTTGTNAGRFRGTATPSGGIDASELISANPNFFAYCHDLAQTIGGTTAYNVSFGASQVMRDFLGAVNFVLASLGSTEGDYAWLLPPDKKTSAAIQLGIWEALHDDDFNLFDATGDVYFQTVPASVLAIYNQFMAARGAASADLSNSLVMVLTHDARQDVITGYNPPELLVPEPGTLVLLGAAAVVAGLTRRRRH